MRRILSALLCLVGVASAASAQQSSTTYAQVVNQATPAISVSSSVNPSIFTQSVLFTATVPADATGTVSFAADGTTVATSNVASGSASFNTGALVAGTHSIVASYSGDGNYLAGTASLSQVVNKATLGQGGIPAAVLGSSPDPSTFGQTVALVATLPANATGTVQFLDGSNPLGSGAVSSGTATLAIATLAGGTHSLTAVYSGDANYNCSTTNTVSQVVQPAASAVNLTASANPIPFSQALGLTAAVPAGATGTVKFFDGSTSLGISPVAAGSANLTVSTLTAGQHTLTAVYSGDGNFSTSTSAPLTETVSQGGTVAEIIATPTSAVVGTSVSFSSLISTGGTLPTGGVTFFDGSTQLAPGTVTQVNATNLLPWSNDYSKWSVQQNGTSTPTLTPSAASGPDGSANTATGIAFPDTSAATATAAITYNVGAGAYAAQPMVVSVWLQNAKPTTMTLAIGDNAGNSETKVCNVGPDWSRCVVKTTFGSGAGAGFSVTLGRASQPAATIAVWGAQGEQAAHLGPYVATSGASATGSGLLATYATSTLAVGVHNMTAQYAGDSNFAAATSSPVTVTITQAASSVTVTSSGSPSVFGSAVTFTATATGSDTQPTGTVTFLSDGQSIGTGTLSNGVASITVSNLPVGSHSITVQYAGDTNNQSATSLAVIQVVSKAAVHIAVTSSANPSIYSQSVTLTFTVTGPGGVPSGTLVVMDGSTPLGMVTLDANGKGVLTTAALKGGNHNLTIIYGGNASFTEDSTTYAQVVTPAPASLELVSSSNPSHSGQAISLTAKVAPTGATGSVAFTVKAPDGTVLSNLSQSVPVDATGVAQMSAAFTTPGTYVVAAQYSGDGNYQPAAAQYLNQLVTGPGDGTPDFTLSAASPNGTVVAGSTFASAINVTGLNGFTGMVKLTCTGTIDETMACNLAKAELQASSSVATTMLQISTESVTVTTVTTAAGALLLGLLLPVGRKRRWAATLTLVLGLGITALSLTGCGSNNRYIQSNGTPKGTYTVLITGTSGSITHTTNVSIVVK